MLLRLLLCTALLILLASASAASQEVPDCWCMILSNLQHDSLAVDTCGINPMNNSCSWFEYLLLVNDSTAESRYYVKGPWHLILKDSSLVLPPKPTRSEDTTFFSYQDVADSTFRSIFLDIEQRYGSLSLYRLLRSKNEDYHLYLYFDNYVHVPDVARYFDSLNYFSHYLENGVAIAWDVTDEYQKQHFQLLSNVVNSFLRINIYDSDEDYHTVQIHNIYGTRIIDNKITANSLSLSIDISELPVGMYIVSIGSFYHFFHVVR